MYASLRRLVFLLLVLSTALLSVRIARAEDAAAAYDDYYAAADGQVQDDQVAAYENYNNQFEGDGDYIKYWTDYAIFPKRCIV